jgi:hypothetical protein
MLSLVIRCLLIMIVHMSLNFARKLDCYSGFVELLSTVFAWTLRKAVFYAYGTSVVSMVL